MPAKTSKPTFAIETIADRRRRQMVDIAGHLIESEGIDTCRVERVAELAQCSRPLVYRYFPKREDLLLAVLNQFDERMDEKLSSQEIDLSLRRLGAAGGKEDEAAVKEFILSVFETVSDIGLGGWMLWNSPELPHLLKGHARKVKSPLDRSRWSEQMSVGGMGDIEIAIAMRVAIALLTELLFRLRDKQLTLNEAVTMAFSSYFSMLAGLSGDGTTENKRFSARKTKAVSKMKPRKKSKKTD